VEKLGLIAPLCHASHFLVFDKIFVGTTGTDLVVGKEEPMEATKKDETACDKTTTPACLET